jgi:hypothetical protein
MERRSLLVVLGLVAALDAVTPHLAAAQTLDLRLGLVRSGFAGERVVESDGLTGGSLAVGVWLPGAGRVSIQPEFQLVQKGAARRSTWMAVAAGDTTFGHTNNPVRLYFAEVPVLARLELSTRSDGVRPHLAAGPYLGWMLHCSSGRIPIGAGGGPGATSGDSVAIGSACVRDGIRRPEIGAVAGAGVRLPLGAATGVANLRYEHGLTSLVKDHWGDVRNRALSLTAGVSLPLGAARRSEPPSRLLTGAGDLIRPSVSLERTEFSEEFEHEGPL